MMKHWRDSVLLFSSLAMTLALLLLAGAGCEPSFDLTLENRTDQVLSIYRGGEPIGEVTPGEQLEMQNLPVTQVYYLIEARDAGGELVYSREFTAIELRDADFKVVIETPPDQ